MNDQVTTREILLYLQSFLDILQNGVTILRDSGKRVHQIILLTSCRAGGGGRVNEVLPNTSKLEYER